MASVVLVIHLILALAIIGLVLLQRSEGGGLGLGASGGLGNLASPQATASALSRVTAICVAGFFTTSLLLAILSGGHKPKSILDSLDQPVPAAAAPAVPVETGAGKADEKAKAPEAKTKAQEKSAPSVPVAE